MLTVVVCHRGGGATFVDLTRAHRALQVRAWSKMEPIWRRCAPGLLLLGSCRTEHCLAHRQEVVMNLGFGYWSLSRTEDLTACICPCCALPVPPRTCAFNNCHWRFVCWKEQGATPFRAAWRTAGDQFVEISAETAGMSEWEEVQVRECALCFAPTALTASFPQD